MGSAVSSGTTNDHLVDNLVKENYLRTPNVEKVFRLVDRAVYFLPSHKRSAYKDMAWRHGNIHISAPCIYTQVIENLDLKPGHTFLNFGSGTGYLSTMVGLLIGPHGINHGVELHEDVINYAYKRLDVFKTTCSAVDTFEFSEPVFVKGNGFSIANGRLYDRIYCGGACPEDHKNFLRDMLKINGILVMPCNQDLLKITRAAEKEYVTEVILSVSFSTLQLPTEEENVVNLPDSTALSLQQICRSTIRCLIRKNAELQHPEIMELPVCDRTPIISEQTTTQRHRFLILNPTRARRLQEDRARILNHAIVDRIFFGHHDETNLFHNFVDSSDDENDNIMDAINRISDNVNSDSDISISSDNTSVSSSSIDSGGDDDDDHLLDINAIATISVSNDGNTNNNVSVTVNDDVNILSSASGDVIQDNNVNKSSVDHDIDDTNRNGDLDNDNDNTGIKNRSDVVDDFVRNDVDNISDKTRVDIDMDDVNVNRNTESKSSDDDDDIADIIMRGLDVDNKNNNVDGVYGANNIGESSGEYANNSSSKDAGNENAGRSSVDVNRNHLVGTIHVGVLGNSLVIGGRVIRRPSSRTEETTAESIHPSDTRKYRRLSELRAKKLNSNKESKTNGIENTRSGKTEKNDDGELANEPSSSKSISPQRSVRKRFVLHGHGPTSDQSNATNKRKGNKKSRKVTENNYMGESSVKNEQPNEDESEGSAGEQPAKIAKREELEGIEENSYRTSDYPMSFDDFDEDWLSSDDDKVLKKKEADMKKEEEKEKEKVPEVPKLTYRSLLEEKIKLLPLPNILKLYINYNRKF